MKILVPIKRVIDYNVKIRIKDDQTGVETNQVKMSMNPFDEIAVEEAVRLKEKHAATEIIVVTIGNEQTQETLRTALALGADKAILVKTEESFEPINIAKILKKMVEQENPKLIIMGKQSIDGDNNQTGQMLAGLLSWPQGTFASQVLIKNDSVEVTREIDGGLETLLLTLPAVITTDLRLNQPRYLSLPNIMKAKSKPLETIELESLALELKAHVQSLKVEYPPKRTGGKILKTPAELVEKLKNEAGVI